jgi:hypothetical protein
MTDIDQIKIQFSIEDYHSKYCYELIRKFITVQKDIVPAYWKLMMESN